MRKFGALTIVGLLFLAGGMSARAAAPASDWPSLNADAAQSNANSEEKSLTASNVLKLRVRWIAPDVPGSYPIVAGGRVYLPAASGRAIYVRVLDAETGKARATLAVDASGGMVLSGSGLELAGPVLRTIDVATGHQVALARAAPAVKGGLFLNPLADGKVVLAGYFGGSGRSSTSSLYAFTPDISRALWKAPSLRAEGTIGVGRVLTEVTSGGTFYDESTGHRLAGQPALHSDWFAGKLLNYTVAAVRGGNATLYAFDGTGRKAWSRAVGPRILVQRWPHAVGSSGLFVATMKPGGVEAIDPELGTVQWRESIPDVERVALANGLLYALTYRLGQPVRLVVMHADTGKVIGGIVLSAGYYAFSSQNGLMVANGMVFIRAVGPSGPALVALGP